jgi:hypothetical protein
MKKFFCNIDKEYAIILLLISFMSLETCSYLSSCFGKYIPSFYDILIYQTNSSRMICFLFTIIVFLLMIRVISTQKCNELISGDIKLKTLIINVLRRFLIFYIMLLITNFIIYILYYRFYWAGFNNNWIYINELALARFSPLFSMILSLTFLLLRMFTLTLLALSITIYSKKEIAFIVIVVMTLLDWGIQSLLIILKPLGFLPIEHTRVFYTEALLPNNEGYTRIPFIDSIFYWTILITIFFVAISLRIKHKKKDVLK